MKAPVAHTNESGAPLRQTMPAVAAEDANVQ